MQYPLENSIYQNNVYQQYPSAHPSPQPQGLNGGVPHKLARSLNHSSSQPVVNNQVPNVTYTRSGLINGIKPAGPQRQGQPGQYYYGGGGQGQP